MNAISDAMTEDMLDEILGALRVDGADAPAMLETIQKAAEAGIPLAQAKGLESQDLDALHDVVLALCDEGRWEKAVPIALQLAVHMPQEPRYSFTAGTCLQRLGRMREAAGLFGLSLLCEEMPVTLFRLGECLSALGEREQARRVFEETVERCRGQDDYRSLQDAAVASLRTL